MTCDGSLGAAEQPKLTHLSSLGSPLVAAWEIELGKVREAARYRTVPGLNSEAPSALWSPYEVCGISSFVIMCEELG